ncbi:MAG: hypothetical protein NVSMB47_04510 [Polyangiales bacterium]
MSRFRVLWASAAGALAIVPFALVIASACSAARSGDEGLGGNDGDVTVDGGGFDLGSPFDDAHPRDAAPCTGIACNVVACPGGGSTTISGTVYAPNGTMPLYNVIVYVPNKPVDPFPEGVHCDKCGALASGDPITTTLTDYKGNFTLKDVPVGSNIPLVIQLGKWRRELVVPATKACTDVKLTDHEQTRLPKKQSEGHMPRIAVTTGGCDKLSCMLPKVGIDASEFGVAGAGKAVTFYKGDNPISFGSDGPAGMTVARSLWSNLDELKKYDLAIFSCECTEAPSSKDATSYKAVADYLAAGGRIFTTDFQYTWYKFSPDSGLNGIGSIPGGAPGGVNPVVLDTSFPKGKALADWMKYTDPAVPYGEVQADFVFDNFNTANKSSVQTWASSGPPHPRFMTINTPVGKPVEAQCGKAVHLDAHINGTDTIDASFPAGCTSKIKFGEEAFAFFFFDLSSCIQNESETPKPPPVK